MVTLNRSYNILVIEDNPGDYALAELYLADQLEVFTLIRAKSFKEAKEVLTLSLFKFDVILLDLSLPDKTGMPLIQEIVAMSNNVAVIVLTGYTDLTFGAKSLSVGVSDYLLKDELTSTMLYKSIIYSVERKRSTLALEESQKQYSALFNLSPLPMYVFQVDSLKFLDVNQAFIKHYGYSREELMQSDITTIRLAEELKALELGPVNSIRPDKNNSIGIMKHVKKSGEVIKVDIQSNFINYEGKNAEVTIATDVTEQLKYVKAIETQNEKLRQISWIQSHVVRAPLARILGLIEVFTQIAENKEDREIIIQYLLQAGNELDNVIKDINQKTNCTEDNIQPDYNLVA